MWRFGCNESKYWTFLRAMSNSFAYFLFSFFNRNLLEQGKQERLTFTALPTYFPTICSLVWTMLLHYLACIDGCRACVSCFCGLVWEVCSLSCR